MVEFVDDLPMPERVLCVFAHPDDAEYFCGGLLAQWAAAGVDISLYLITSGDKGSSDPQQLNPQHIITVRESEARAAADYLGIREVIFQRWRDGELLPALGLRRAIVRQIRLKQPDTVMSSDPLLRYRELRRINHPDHWTVAEAVQAAVYPAARDHLNFPELYQDEGLTPHKVRWLYMALPTDPNYRVETTTTRQKQVEALKLHASQTGDPEAFEKRMTERYDKTLTGSGEPRYAEYFRVMELP